MTIPLDRHCKRKGCRCTHTPPCDHGWIENTDSDGQETGTTSPCPTCRPELAEAVMLAADRDDMRRRLAEHRIDPEGLGDAEAWRK